MSVDKFCRGSQQSELLVNGYIRLCQQSTMFKDFEIPTVIIELVVVYENITIKIEEHFTFIGIQLTSSSNTMQNKYCDTSPELTKLYKTLDLFSSKLYSLLAIDLKYYYYDKFVNKDIVNEYFEQIIWKRYINPSIFCVNIDGIFYDNISKASNHIYYMMDYKCHPMNNFYDLMHCNIGNKLTENQIKIIIYDIIHSLQHLHSNDIYFGKLKALYVIGHYELDNVKLSVVNIENYHQNNRNYDNYKIDAYYMQPEAINGNISMESDIWSLGVLATELATGQPPNYQLKPMQAMMLLFKDEYKMDPEDIIFGAKQCSKEFKDFISVCMVRDKTKRAKFDELLSHKWLKDVMSKEKEMEYRNELKLWLKVRLDVVIKQRDSKSVFKWSKNRSFYTQLSWVEFKKLHSVSGSVITSVDSVFSSPSKNDSISNRRIASNLSLTSMEFQSTLVIHDDIDEDK